MDEATATEVNDLDLATRVRLDENVFGLQIAMDQLKIVDEGKRLQDLLSDSLQPGNVEVKLLLHLAVVLGILIEVISQELCHDEQVLLVIEEVNELQQVLGVEVIAVGIYIPQELDLINRLIEVVLVVLNNLHADHLFGVDVITLNGLRESCTSQVLNNLITACHDAVDDDWEIFRFFETSLLSIKDNTQGVTVVDDVVKLSRIEFVIRWHEFDPSGQY